MKVVHVEFEFSKECPYNLDGTCTFPLSDVLECKNGRHKIPPDNCPISDKD